MAITVRRAEQDDIPALLYLIESLADYEKLAPPDAEARERLKRDGWPSGTDTPRFQAWLAEIADETTQRKQAVGYAITFYTYSSFLARPTLYIEDIFVLPDYRRQSVGSALMEALIQEAKATHCGRIEWVVLDWNTSAQQFYQRLGASHLTDWQYYRLTLES